MKKLFFCIFFIYFLSFFSSCESDDICTDKELTPRLILRVYDKDSPEKLKNIPNLLVLGKEKNEALSFATTDSIAVPLRTLKPQTSFILVKNATFNSEGKLILGEATELDFRYIIHHKFINKGCGYKVSFDNISAKTSENSWISSVKLTSKSFENEKKSVVHIYF